MLQDLLPRFADIEGSGNDGGDSAGDGACDEAIDESGCVVGLRSGGGAGTGTAVRWVAHVCQCVADSFIAPPI